MKNKRDTSSQLQGKETKTGRSRRLEKSSVFSGMGRRPFGKFGRWLSKVTVLVLIKRSRTFVELVVDRN